MNVRCLCLAAHHGRGGYRGDWCACRVRQGQRQDCRPHQGGGRGHRRRQAAARTLTHGQVRRAGQPGECEDRLNLNIHGSVKLTRSVLFDSLAWQANEVQAEVYALEMAIHVKRAERERKRQELEAEFASVFQVRARSHIEASFQKEPIMTCYRLWLGLSRRWSVRRRHWIGWRSHWQTWRPPVCARTGAWADGPQPYDASGCLGGKGG